MGDFPAIAMLVYWSVGIVYILSHGWYGNKIQPISTRLLCHVLVGTWKCEVVLLRQGLAADGVLRLVFDRREQRSNNTGLNETEWNYAILNMYEKKHLKAAGDDFFDCFFLVLKKQTPDSHGDYGYGVFLRTNSNKWLNGTIAMAPRTPAMIKNMPRATGICPGKEKSDWDSKSNFTCFGKILSWVFLCFSLGQSQKLKGKGYFTSTTSEKEIHPPTPSMDSRDMLCDSSACGVPKTSWWFTTSTVMWFRVSADNM